MTLDHGQLVDQPIKTPYMAGVMSHQVDNHGRIDEVEVDEETEMISDERPVHVREVVSDHEQNAKWTADPDHKSGDQRQSDQQMIRKSVRGSVVGVAKAAKKSWKVTIWLRKPPAL